MADRADLKWMAWEITRRCNLDCVHCRSCSDDTWPLLPFSTEWATALLDQVAEFANPVVVLTGGEPLLRPDVFDIAAHGTSLGLRMCLATNGLLLDDVAAIKASGIRMVALSLDGSTAAVHDAFRGQPGAFDAVIGAARKLREHGVPFLINSSFTKRNQDEIRRVYRLAKRLGATAWYMFLIVPTGRGEDLLDELVSAEDYEKILEWHYDAELDETDLLMRPTCAPQYYRIIAQRDKAEGRHRQRRTLTLSTGGQRGCIAGQWICLLDVDGNVLPCSYFPLTAGNVNERPFAEIWQDSPLLEELRDPSRYEGRCGACEYIKVCGGCRARAYAVSGNYLAEEPYCEHVPLRWRRAASEADRH